MKLPRNPLHPALLALGLSFATVPLAAQAGNQDIELNATLVIRTAQNDLDLDSLMNAILREPAVAAAVANRLGTAMTHFDNASAGLEHHSADYFQMHLSVQLTATRPLEPAERKGAIEAIVDIATRRLDALLYQGPAERLSKQRDQLRIRMEQLAVERAEHLGDSEDLAAAANSLQGRRDSLQAQRLETRQTLLIETRVHEHLVERRAVHQKALADLRNHQHELDRNIGDLEVRLAELGTALAQLAPTTASTKATKEQAAELQALAGQMRQVEAERREGAVERDRLLESLQEELRMQAVSLEQLPQTALTLQRARARQDSLDEEEKQLAVDAAELKARARSAMVREVAAEQLLVDQTITRELFAEVQGKLARLTPVQVDLLRRD